MSYIRKTSDEWRLYGDYGNGFEEVIADDTRHGILKRLRDYRENEPGIPFRVRCVRIPAAVEVRRREPDPNEIGFPIVIDEGAQP